jgi:peptidoglycan L-alanyl-D-glutamate endopeptidase CwlK
MKKYSERSKTQLATCHPELQRLFYKVLAYDYDHTILEGHRGQEAQDEAFRTGHSKLQFPYSRHNAEPSMAVDCAPYPIDWSDVDRFYHFAGFVLGVAASLNIKVRWGGDWDMDMNLKDQTFFDLPHFELMED